jgi:hypothetical protein
VLARLSLSPTEINKGLAIKTLKFWLDFGGSLHHTVGTMSDDQFTKLFVYMHQEFAKVNEKLDQKADKKRLEIIYNLLDATSKG